MTKINLEHLRFLLQLKKLCFVAVFYLTATANVFATSFKISEDGNAVLKDGAVWMSLHNFPSIDSDGDPIGHNRLGLINADPTGKYALVTGVGDNHQWLAVLNVQSGNIECIKRLTESGATQALWSPSGTCAAIAVIFGSGKRGVILVTPNGNLINLNVAISGVSKEELINPQWSSDGESIECRIGGSEKTVSYSLK